MRCQMDNKIVDNQSPEISTETLQELFCRLEEFFSKKYEYRSNIYYTAPAWVVNQFFESIPEDKEDDKQCQT